MTARNTFTINVNLDCPDANREVSVCEIERIEGVGENKNRLHKGFWITTPINTRCVLDDKTTTHWKARVFSSDTLLLSIQAWDCSQLKDRDEFSNVVDDNVLEGIDAAHHALADAQEDKKEARKWKHLFLKFGGGVELSAKAINENAGEDDKLQLEVVPIAFAHPEMRNVQCTSVHAAWKIARADIKANKKGKLE